MEELIRTRRLKLNSKRTTLELLTFIVNDVGKAEADEGCYDDLVMSLAIGCFVLQDMLSTTPMEHELGLHNEIHSDLYKTGFEHHVPTLGGISKEDLRWLIGK